MLKQTLYEVAIVITGSVLIGLVVNALRTDGLEILGRAETMEMRKPVAGGVNAISIEDAAEAFDNRIALFADARAPAEFASGHIQGAVNLPENQFDEWIDDFAAGTAPDQLIIAYCDGMDCALAENLAERLFLAGFERAFYLPDGWGRWREHGLPIEDHPQHSR